MTPSPILSARTPAGDWIAYFAPTSIDMPFGVGASEAEAAADLERTAEWREMVEWVEGEEPETDIDAPPLIEWRG